MDLRKVKKLIELAEQTGVAELEVRNGDESIRVVMPGPGFIPPAVVTSPIVALEPEPAKAGEPSTQQSLSAPMAGVFYQAPHPDAEPFVSVGQAVQEGDVLCIIESMKMMNNVEATLSGTITEILVENGAPVATGAPLFLLS